MIIEGEEHARITTMWTPRNGRVCYPATEQAAPLGNILARLVVETWTTR